MRTERVLVTGGSGFLGAHTIVRALERGHHVRTTLRSPARRAEVRAMVAAGGAEPDDRLSFATADLLADDGWDAAIDGCDAVLHVASPFPAAQPDDADELVTPAREGTRRVLRAADAAGVRRVVVVSSFAAVSYGHEPTDRPFTEDDWTDLNGPDVTPYVRSKTLAEHAAWELAERAGRPELVVVNPTGILGPVLGPDLSASVRLVAGLLAGVVDPIPDLSFSPVDVRDVAELLLMAADAPHVAGRRLIASGDEETTLAAVAEILRDALGPDGARVPTTVAVERSPIRRSSNARARQLLGWAPRPLAETVVDTARSLIDRSASTTT